MKKGELCQILAAELPRVLNDTRAKPVIGADNVRLEWHDGEVRRIALMPTVQRGQSYQLSYWSAISHTQVELAHALALGLSRKSFNMRWTLLGGSNTALQYIGVETEADAIRWCAGVADHLLGQGSQWLSQPTSLAELHPLFNTAPAQELPACPYLLSRAEKGIIIAKLRCDPALPALVDTYRARLITADIVLTFDQVVNWLNTHSLDQINQLLLLR